MVYTILYWKKYEKNNAGWYIQVTRQLQVQCRSTRRWINLGLVLAGRPRRSLVGRIVGSGLCNAEIFLYKPWKPKGFFQFEIIINILVSSFRFIWIPMLWFYGVSKLFISFSAGTVFKRQNLPSTESEVIGRQILTSKDSPRAEMVNLGIPWRGRSVFWSRVTLCDRWTEGVLFKAGYT